MASTSGNFPSAQAMGNVFPYGLFVTAGPVVFPVGSIDPTAIKSGDINNYGFVNLLSDQNVAGVKTWDSNAIFVAGLTVAGGVVAFPTASIASTMVNFPYGYCDLINPQQIGGIKEFYNTAIFDTGFTVVAGPVTFPNTAVSPLAIDNTAPYFVDINTAQVVVGNKTFATQVFFDHHSNQYGILGEINTFTATNNFQALTCTSLTASAAVNCNNIDCTGTATTGNLNCNHVDTNGYTIDAGDVNADVVTCGTLVAGTIEGAVMTGSTTTSVMSSDGTTMVPREFGSMLSDELSTHSITTPIKFPTWQCTDSNGNIFASNDIISSTFSNAGNVGIGNTQVLPSITNAQANVAIGGTCFPLFTSGIGNVAVGVNGAGGLASGNGNTFMGYQTSTVSSSVSNSTAIGCFASIDSSHQIMVGTSNETVVLPGAIQVRQNVLNGGILTTNSNGLAAIQPPVNTVNFTLPTVTGEVWYGASFTYVIGLCLSIDGVSYPIIFNANNSFNVEPYITAINLQGLQMLGTLNFTSAPLLTSIVGPNIVNAAGTWGGTLPLLTNVSLPVCVAAGGFNYNAPIMTTLNLSTLKIITASFTIVMNALTSLNLDNLLYVQGSFNPTCSILTTLSLPSLKYVLTYATTLPLVTTYYVPNFKYASTFALTAPVLVTLNMPSFTFTATFTMTLAACTTINMGSFTTCQAFTVNAPVVTTISMPLLSTVTSNFSLTAALLTTFSLSSIATISGTLVVTAPNMTTISFGTVLKVLSGNVTLSGMKLNQTSVDNILVLLASLDGTNGTTIYSGRTVLLNGGTSSAPSSTGASAKAILVARGCTVTTN